MHAKRLSPLLLGSSLAATSTFAFALGLGDATPRSSLGEPLLLNIPINIAPGEEVGEHCFTLRPAPFNQASGLPAVTQGSVEVMRTAAGRAVLRVSTSAPVDEPMIAVGVETRCKINVARDYSIFLSPRSGSDATLPADAVWDVPASAPLPALAEVPAAVPAISAPAESPIAAAPAIVAAPAPRPSIKSADPVAAPAVQPAPRAMPVAAKPGPAVVRQAAAAAPAPTTVTALAAIAVRQPAVAPTRTMAAPTALPTAAPPGAPPRSVASGAQDPRDARLAELTAAVEAMRAQLAAQEKRLQDLAAPQGTAALRVSGQYRPDSVIPATLNVPIARSEGQTVVYRAAPVAVQPSAGVSLETLAIAMLATAIAATAAGHYAGRRAAGNANSNATGGRTGRRPVRRPRD